MQGAEERRLKRISNTPQGEVIEGNAAEDTLMMDQGRTMVLDINKKITLDPDSRERFKTFNCCFIG